MSIGRFLAGIGAVIYVDGKYLLLQRSLEKDFGAGIWECVTGRVDQGEGFEDAVKREVREELQVEAEIEFIIGTTHFYRGEPMPENELVGVIYACTIQQPEQIVISPEHSQFRWLSIGEARALLLESDPSTRWVRLVLERAELMRSMLPAGLLAETRRAGFELN